MISCPTGTRSSIGFRCEMGAAVSTPSTSARGLHQTRRLGLVGGMSWHSTALYYKRINQAFERKLGEHHSFQGEISNLDYADLVSAAYAGRWFEAEAIIAGAAAKLDAAQCDVVVLTAVTAHFAYDAVCRATSATVPHILHGVARALAELHPTRVGILGTGITCGSPFLRTHLGKRHELLFLDQPPQKELDAVINGILTTGSDLALGRPVLVDAIRQLEGRGAEAIVLACTELPLLLPVEDARLPLVDAVQLHIEDICNLILSKCHDS